MRILRRFGALALYAGAGALVWFMVLAPLLDSRDGDSEDDGAAAAAADTTVEQVEVPPRPESAPERIPRWGWQMHQWHLVPVGERGPRPVDAPRRLPDWYWEWREWRLALTG
jgi:hypothetical protein